MLPRDGSIDQVLNSMNREFSVWTRGKRIFQAEPIS